MRVGTVAISITAASPVSCPELGTEEVLNK